MVAAPDSIAMLEVLEKRRGHAASAHPLDVEFYPDLQLKIDYGFDGDMHPAF